MLDCKQLLPSPHQCRRDKPSHASQQDTLQKHFNINLQIKRNDHMLNHQTNDVLVTEKRKKKIDLVATQHSSISRLPATLRLALTVCSMEYRVGQYYYYRHNSKMINIKLRNNKRIASISRHRRKCHKSIYAKFCFFQITFFLVEMRHYSL